MMILGAVQSYYYNLNLNESPNTEQLFRLWNLTLNL